MRPTENFLLFLPCGKGVEGGSGQFFSVLFCKTALAILYTIACAAFSKNLSKISYPEPPSPPFPHGIPSSICDLEDVLLGSISQNALSIRNRREHSFCFFAPRHDSCRTAPSALLCRTVREKTQQKNGAKLRFHKFRNAFRAEKRAALRAEPLTSFCRKAGPSV